MHGELALATAQLELGLGLGPDPATVLHLRAAAGSFGLYLKKTLKVIETKVSWSWFSYPTFGCQVWQLGVLLIL